MVPRRATSCRTARPRASGPREGLELLERRALLERATGPREERDRRPPARHRRPAPPAHPVPVARAPDIREPFDGALQLLPRFVVSGDIDRLERKRRRPLGELEIAHLEEEIDAAPGRSREALEELAEALESPVNVARDRDPP